MGSFNWRNVDWNHILQDPAPRLARLRGVVRAKTSLAVFAPHEQIEDVKDLLVPSYWTATLEGPDRPEFVPGGAGSGQKINWSELLPRLARELDREKLAQDLLYLKDICPQVETRRPAIRAVFLHPIPSERFNFFCNVS